MIKTFKVQAEYNDLMYVVLQVDTDKLTPELATNMNNLFRGAKGRVEDEDGDVVRAVVRRYGAEAILEMLLKGGASFKASNRSAVSQWTNQLQGLLADINHELFCDDGIRVIEAQVEIPDFEGVELLDITAQCA